MSQQMSSLQDKVAQLNAEHAAVKQAQDKAANAQPTIRPGVVSGVEDGSQAWCMVGGRVVVAAGSVNGGIVQCVSVAGVAGNTTMEVSVNGQEFTASGLMV